LLGQRLFIAHVGDSRAYMLIDNELSLLTTDHSYVQRLQDAGQLTEEEAAVHPQRNMLYKAVGQGGLLEIDTFTRSLPGSGMLVLCSDGLWGLVNDSKIQEVITSDDSLMKMTDKLVNMALEAGGHDNISVVLVKFSS
jgi:protein phosphatase